MFSQGFFRELVKFARPDIFFNLAIPLVRMGSVRRVLGQTSRSQKTRLATNFCRAFYDQLPVSLVADGCGRVGRLQDSQVPRELIAAPGLRCGEDDGRSVR